MRIDGHVDYILRVPLTVDADNLDIAEERMIERAEAMSDEDLVKLGTLQFDGVATDSATIDGVTFACPEVGEVEE